MKNLMVDIAKLLGVELGEKINIENSLFNPHKITNEGLLDHNGNNVPVTFLKLLLGQYEITKPLLTKEEKEYFEYVLRPYKDRVIYMSLNYNNDGRWIKIKLFGEVFNFPNIINTDTLQCTGLKAKKEYTLQELGLFEGEES